MALHTLTKLTDKGKKRRGRGVGSGKGFHTTGRGQKGQGARNSIGVLFEGVKTKKSLLHRLPMLRGKNKFKSLGKNYAVSVSLLENHPAGDVTVTSLVENGVIRYKDSVGGVKVVGSATLTKKFTLKVPASASSVKSVTEAGGTIVSR